MLVRADPDTNSISLLSFPRDMLVEIRCPGKHAVLRQDQRGVRVLRPAGLAPDGRGAHGRADQLPDHGQLPRLPPDRRPARRRLDRRRPALLQRPRRRLRLRDDQPPPRLPAARGPPGARLRALPPHGLRPLPRRAPAAVREGVQGPDQGELRADRAAEGRQRVTKNVEVGAGRRRRASTAARCSRTRSSPTALPRGRVFQTRIEGLEGFAELDRRVGEHHARCTTFTHPDVESSEKATAVALGEKPKPSRRRRRRRARRPSRS